MNQLWEPMKPFKPSLYNSLMIKYFVEFDEPRMKKEIEKFYDLSNCDKFTEEHPELARWFKEIFLNKNHIIDKFVRTELDKNNDKYIVIYFAAGKSLLTLKLISGYEEKITKILEIDKSEMDKKQELYDLHFPGLAHKVKCLTFEINSFSFLDMLKIIINDYFSEHRVLIVIDDISFIHNLSELKIFVNKLSSRDMKNKLLLNYIVNEDELNEEFKEIKDKICNELKKYSLFDNINSFKADEISNIIYDNGGELDKIYSLTMAEKERTGVNKFFRNHNECWLEYSSWKI